MIVKADVKRKVITFSANFSFDLKREVAWPGQMNLDLNHNAAVTMQCNICNDKIPISLERAPFKCESDWILWQCAFQFRI